MLLSFPHSMAIAGGAVVGNLLEILISKNVACQGLVACSSAVRNGQLADFVARANK